MKTLLSNKPTDAIRMRIYLVKRKTSSSEENQLYLKGTISLTGFADGMSINNEFVKNSNLLLASRFLGIFAAESFTVRRRYSRLIRSFCGNR